jgi:HAD superfamily hydrolase (TIGR01458 family)
MAAILLDVDGVLHVSGEAVPGAAGAVRRLRAAGHSLRFVTNNTTRSRRRLADELRAMGIDLEEDELQTTAAAAARTLRHRRVLALTMEAIWGDLEDVELVDDRADAVLVGGADETAETGRVFSYDNLSRAFSELGAGADLYCLHRNRWWQTSRGPVLDAGAFVAGLEYAAETQATVLGKPSETYFAAALAALEADARDALMVGDDIENDIAGAQAYGLRALLVRTGKFRAERVESSGARPDATLPSVASLPEWLEEHAA